MSFSPDTRPRRNPFFLLMLSMMFAGLLPGESWLNPRVEAFVAAHCTTSVAMLALVVALLVVAIAYAATPHRGTFSQWLRTPAMLHALPLALMGFAVLGGIIMALVMAAVPTLQVRPSAYINVASASR